MVLRLDQRAVASPLIHWREPQFRELVRRRPRRVWADVARCYALIVLAWWLLIKLDFWWVYPLSFVLIGTQQSALFILGHDGMHTNLLRNRRANDFLSAVFLYAPLGMFLPDQRRNHLAHHRLVGSDEDPDRYLHKASNKASPGVFLFFLSGLMTFPRTLLKVMPFGNSSDSRTGHIGDFLANRWPTFLAQGLIFGTILLLMPWWYYLLFWALPIYVLVFVPDEIRAFCEHAQPVLPDSAADPQRLTTFVPNRLERIFFSPMNMNYHAEHHLWPFIPYYNLPKVHPFVRGSQDVEVRSSYLAFLWSYFRKLPLTAPSPSPA